MQEQARNYRVLTDIMLNNENCPNMVIWGLKDNNSWRDQSYPLLYNSGLQPKPAYYAVRSALRHRALITGEIETTTVIPKVGSSEIYDLRGRKVIGYPQSPGIYIVNGKKIVITP